MQVGAAAELGDVLGGLLCLGVTGAKLVGMMMPSACLAQPCSVSMLDELVRPISSFGFTPWRSISLSTPQV